METIVLEQHEFSQHSQRDMHNKNQDLKSGGEDSIGGECYHGSQRNHQH